MVILDFDKIEYYYDTMDSQGNRLWTKEMVKGAVVKEKITAEQYKEIVGEDYIA